MEDALDCVESSESVNSEPINYVGEVVSVIEGSTTNENIVEPKVGMIFKSGDEFTAFCYTYAFKCGFEWFIRSTTLLEEYKAEGATRGRRRKRHERQFYMMSRIRLVCKKGGKGGKKVSSATGCGAFVEARVRDGFMVIGTCSLTHNHELFPNETCFMASFSDVGEYFKKRMMLNDRDRVPVESVGPVNLPVNCRDQRNVAALERRRDILSDDVVSVEEYLVQSKILYPDFYYAIEKDNEGKLLNIFWADARQRAQFKVFGDVVSFDTPLLCNEIPLLFAPFMGVNHHGNSICLAAALIMNADADTFSWVFERWLECMGAPPSVIITYQCKAVDKAVEMVFPGTPHRLCLWHILKSVSKNLRGFSGQQEFCADLKTVVHECVTESEFDEEWMNLVEKFGLQSNPWIKEAFNIRRRWVPAYWRGTFCAGMSSTQRIEQEAIQSFKEFVSAAFDLRNFFTKFEIAQGSNVEEENYQNWLCKDKHCKYYMNHLVEVVYGDRYTNEKFKQVQEQLYGIIHTNFEVISRNGSYVKFRSSEKITIPMSKEGRRSFEVTMDTNDMGEKVFACTCKLFEFTGILCKHISQCIFFEPIEHISDKYILPRWRKDLIRGYEHIRVGYYNPEESPAHFMRYLDVAFRLDYMATLAMRNDECYAIYERGIDNVVKALERHVASRK